MADNSKTIGLHGEQVDGLDLAAAADAIIGQFRRAGRALRASDFDAPGEWAGALTMPQLRVLYLLGRHPSLPVGSVAEAMRISQPSATETIDRLVRAGFVSRTTCTSDRRVVRTALTEAGRMLIDRPWEARRAMLAEALRGATRAQREAMALGLETLCQILSATPEASRAARGPDGALPEASSDARGTGGAAPESGHEDRASGTKPFDLHDLAVIGRDGVTPAPDSRAPEDCA
jgi:DNA-binding MarR family transcriptional regulator